MFDREFVKTGIFATDLSKALHLAFDRRQTNDYGEMIEVDEPTAEETLKLAKHFIVAIVEYMNGAGYSIDA